MAKKLVAIIIQARMGSTRLPGKSLMEIERKPLLWHVVQRAEHSKQVDQVVIATTVEKKDKTIADLFAGSKTQVYCGGVDDVLDRYYNAAKLVKADVIVRITGDSPLVDPFLIDKAIEIIKKGGYDYVSNSQPPWMDGFDVEVFTFSALEKAWKEAKMASEREHVTPYMRNNPEFKEFYLENDARLVNVHASIDKPEDLEFVRALYKLLLEQGKNHTFTYLDVIKILEEKPELLKINKNSVINEGYFKSLREDKKVK